MASESLRHGQWSAYAGLTLTALFWAGNAVVARGMVGQIPPVTLAFWRWVVALAIIAPFGVPRLRREWGTLRAHWRSLAVMAALSVGAFNTLLYLAAQSTTAVNITLLNAAMPIVVTLLARLILATPVTARQAAGITLALAGMIAVVARGRWQTLAQLDFQPGDLIMVAAICCWALFSVLLRRQNVPLDPIAFLTAQIALGLPVILPFYLLELALTGGFELRADLVWPFLYVGLFPGVLAYAFWNNGVRRVGPPRAAMFIYLTPVFAAGLASVFLDERLQPFHAAGGVLILAGLWLATRVPRKL